jgi:hypothetical protein
VCWHEIAAGFIVDLSQAVSVPGGFAGLAAVAACGKKRSADSPTGVRD